MSLLQRYLPRHDFAETHHLTMAAPPAAVLDAVARADLSDDPLVRALLQLRGLPLRLRQRFGPRPNPAPDVWGGFGLHRFTPLGRDGDREIAWGLAGRFWQASGGLVHLPDAAAFENFNQPGHAKLVMMGVWSFLRQFMYTKFIVVVDEDINTRDWNEVIWAITTRMDPVRDTVLVENTPIDYLDFASPISGLGGKMGLDATNKHPGETSREWGTPIVMDTAVKARVDAMWGELGL